MAGYVPHRGDLVALTFDLQTGHEQKGRRPALVISHDLFNQHTGLCMACPVINTKRDFPFHVPIPTANSQTVTGFVMVEQVRSVDYRGGQRETHRTGVRAGSGGSAVDSRRLLVLALRPSGRSPCPGTRWRLSPGRARRR